MVGYVYFTHVGVALDAIILYLGKAFCSTQSIILGLSQTQGGTGSMGGFPCRLALTRWGEQHRNIGYRNFQIMP